jgi:manganese transport protein
LAPTLFAVALIAAGQSSTITGTLAGQIVMEGYLHLRINPWIRRLMTRLIAVIPAVIVILINGENNIDSLLILSQVILSLQLGFAVIPLILFVSDKKTMGSFAIKPLTKILAWIITSILVYLNLRMVTEQAGSYFATSDNIFWKAVIILGGLLFVALLIISVVYPLMGKRRRDIPVELHPEASSLQQIAVPVYKKIAVALEFSEKDEKLLSYAIGQAHPNTSFVLIHVVESVPAKILEKESDDLETRTDQQHLDFYVQRFKQMGYEATGVLGFNRRSKEIVRIIKEANADMLVIGAHGHTGIKDWFYGQTIDSVRHELNIPVLVVNV